MKVMKKVVSKDRVFYFDGSKKSVIVDHNYNALVVRYSGNVYLMVKGFTIQRYFKVKKERLFIPMDKRLIVALYVYGMENTKSNLLSHFKNTVSAISAKHLQALTDFEKTLRELN